MLTRFNYNNCYKKIPFCGSIYEIHPNGDMRDTVYKRSIPVKIVDDIPTVTTDNGEWFDGMSVALILAITYKTPNLPISRFKELRLLYKDGNLRNHSLYNTVWASPEGTMTHPLFPGYCYIPGLSRYLINREGEVISPISGTKLSPYVDANGYLMYGVQPDIGKRTIVGMHRLLSLAWLKYPADVDRLDVNHIDCNKSNNALDNLEWVTRSRNNQHMHENNLSNSIRVLTRDVLTGYVSSYYGMSEAGRVHGCNHVTIRNRINGSNLGKTYGGFQYKLDEDTPWPIITEAMEVSEIPEDGTCSIFVDGSNMGTVKEFRTTLEAANYMSVCYVALSRALAKENRVIFGEYMVYIQKSAMMETS